MAKVRISPFAFTSAKVQNCTLHNTKAMETIIGELLTFTKVAEQNGTFEVVLQNDYLKHPLRYVPKVTVQIMTTPQYRQELQEDMRKATTFQKNPTRNLVEEYQQMDSLTCDFVVTQVRPAVVPAKRPVTTFF